MTSWLRDLGCWLGSMCCSWVCIAHLLAVCNLAEQAQPLLPDTRSLPQAALAGWHTERLLGQIFSLCCGCCLLMEVNASICVHTIAYGRPSGCMCSSCHGPAGGAVCWCACPVEPWPPLCVYCSCEPACGLTCWRVEMHPSQLTHRRASCLSGTPRAPPCSPHARCMARVPCALHGAVLTRAASCCLVACRARRRWPCWPKRPPSSRCQRMQYCSRWVRQALVDTDLMP